MTLPPPAFKSPIFQALSSPGTALKRLTTLPCKSRTFCCRRSLRRAGRFRCQRQSRTIALMRTMRGWAGGSWRWTSRLIWARPRRSMRPCPVMSSSESTVMCVSTRSKAARHFWRTRLWRSWCALKRLRPPPAGTHSGTATTPPAGMRCRPASPRASRRVHTRCWQSLSQRRRR